MILSENTVNILKNFATISGNLFIQPGSELKTWSVTKSLYAQAKVEEEFPGEFGIYDLNEFLAVLSLFSKPELTFEDKFVTVSEGPAKIRYFKAEPSLLAYPNREMRVPEFLVSFDITAGHLAVIAKTAATLKAPDMSFASENGKIVLSVGVKKNPTANTFSSPIADCPPDVAFKANILTRNMKMIVADYNVDLSAKRQARFTTKDGNLQYRVAMEADSEF